MGIVERIHWMLEAFVLNWNERMENWSHVCGMHHLASGYNEKNLNTIIVRCVYLHFLLQQNNSTNSAESSIFFQIFNFFLILHCERHMFIIMLWSIEFTTLKAIDTLSILTLTACSLCSRINRELFMDCANSIFDVMQ